MVLFALLASLVRSVAAQADPDVAHDGKWTASIVAEDGKRHSAQLTVRQFGGSWSGWLGSGPGVGKACAAKAHTVTVQASNSSSLEFTVWGDTDKPPCPNLTIVTKMVDEKRFEGTVEGVGAVALTRR